MSDNQTKRDPSEMAYHLFDGIIKEGKSLADEVADNAKAVAQSALGNLDVVSRDEFDAQSTVLRKTRARIEQLERAIEELSATIEKLEKRT